MDFFVPETVNHQVKPTYKRDFTSLFYMKIVYHLQQDNHYNRFYYHFSPTLKEINQKSILVQTPAALYHLLYESNEGERYLKTCQVSSV